MIYWLSGGAAVEVAEMLVKWRANEVLKNLHGFLCVYKQRDMSVAALKSLIVKRICDHGNSLQQPKVPMINMPIVEPHEKSGASVVVGLRRQPDYTLVSPTKRIVHRQVSSARERGPVQQTGHFAGRVGADGGDHVRCVL